MPGNYANVAAITDNQAIDAADVVGPINALDDALKAVADAPIVTMSASAALNNETTLATALASPPAIGGTTPASVRGSSFEAVSAGTTEFIANTTANGQLAGTRFRRNGSDRWFAGKENTSETGSNAGSNYGIARYDDAGAFLGFAVTIIRSSGAVAIAGALSKGSGTFLIDHPLDPEDRVLYHGFVEAPRYDLIYRGKAKLAAGRASVQVDEVCSAHPMTPGTFEALVDTDTAQVYVVNNEGWARVRGKLSGGTLFIECENALCMDTVDWLIIAERDDPFIHTAPNVGATGKLQPEWEKGASPTDGVPVKKGDLMQPQAKAQQAAARERRRQRRKAMVNAPLG